MNAYSGFLISLIFFSLVNFKFSLSSNFREVKDLIPPPSNIELYTFGFRYQLADFLWIRAIQDFDYCDSPISKNRCKDNSWLFLMLDGVTRLDPDYRMPYDFGALALSIIISDIDGATQLFDKGAKNFPNDRKIQYQAGYHALLEEKNNLKAAERFDRAADLGAPAWLKGLAGRLYNKEGRKEDVERLLTELTGSEENKWLAERLKNRIQSGE